VVRLDPIRHLSQLYARLRNGKDSRKSEALSCPMDFLPQPQHARNYCLPPEPGRITLLGNIAWATKRWTLPKTFNR